MHDHLESAAHVEVNAGAIGEAVDSEGKLLVLSSCNHECGYIVLLVQVIHIVLSTLHCAVHTDPGEGKPTKKNNKKTLAL